MDDIEPNLQELGLKSSNNLIQNNAKLLQSEGFHL